MKKLLLYLLVAILCATPLFSTQKKTINVEKKADHIILDVAEEQTINVNDNTNQNLFDEEVFYHYVQDMEEQDLASSIDKTEQLAETFDMEYEEIIQEPFIIEKQTSENIVFENRIDEPSIPEEEMEENITEEQPTDEKIISENTDEVEKDIIADGEIKEDVAEEKAIDEEVIVEDLNEVEEDIVVKEENVIEKAEVSENEITDTSTHLEETEETEKQIVDITEKLNNLMRKNATYLKNFRAKYGYFAAAILYYIKVTDGGDWDIKLTNEWKFDKNTTYIYQGIEMRMDDPGNIHFGYVGAILFSEEFVCLGAGINNILKNDFVDGNRESYYDDPQDQQMMRWGYRMYKENQI